MSHIAIIGATGRAGSRLLEEALRRGHTVTAIARKASEKLSGRANVKAVDVDALDAPALEKALAGHDAVFSAAHFSTVPPQAIIGPVQRAGVKRLLVVGGAGSLFAAPGLKVIETPNFPDAYRAEATAGGVFLDALRNEKELDWTFLSPSAEFVEGERTGNFRLGKDDLLVSAEGRSWITFEDYAIAFIDELEKPAHSRQRYTIGY
jgi:putative NADH-flavin reductase